MIKGLIHSGLSTNNLNGSIDFYTKAFGFEVIFKEEKIQEEIESITGIKSQTCRVAQLSVKGSDHIIEQTVASAIPIIVGTYLEGPIVQTKCLGQISIVYHRGPLRVLTP